MYAIRSYYEAIDKPFVVLMNTTNPESDNTKSLCKRLQERYSTPVIPVDCLSLDESDIRGILTQVLFAFPIKEINIEMPRWITCLEKGHWLKNEVFTAIKAAANGIQHRNNFV